MALTHSNVSDFWLPFEETIGSWNDMKARIAVLSNHESKLLAWRGITNSELPMNSNLFRQVWKKSGAVLPPEEKKIAAEEKRIVAEFKRWGLHFGQRGRLSFVEQLTIIQHYGGPTRFIDISFSPYVAAWFAVFDPSGDHGTKDSRLFCVDVTGRLINENPSALTGLESIEDNNPNWKLLQDWDKSTVWAWRPPYIDQRLFAQHAGFLLGKVPSAKPQHPKTTNTKRGGSWRADERRTALSIALRINKAGSKRGKSEQPAYTARIAARAKPEILKGLKRELNIDQKTMFPDVTGFVSNLRNS